jgi:hypothetical protein
MANAAETFPMSARVLLLLLAASIACPDAKGASPPLIGAWEYSDTRFWLNVHLWQNGNCLVSAQTFSAPTADFFECTYTVKGDALHLERRGVEYRVPVRLFYDAGRDSFRVEGEPGHVLTRKKEKR